MYSPMQMGGAGGQQPNYVGMVGVGGGEPLAIKITITNLNNNIDKPFLADMLAK